ncbi:hypothetical protein AC579_10604 [Pseudocercospora musae]|uniref:Uncharacterized protein n=1 Tax=Pseudocercospora musae TaxID=113226 RepID=A0A139IKY9_9PEZI|nr:hypothetical protein AC579_10604 [Pseudocercospora musae]
MGLLDKIENKLSGNKTNTKEEQLQHDGVDSSRQHGTFTGEASHLQSGTNTAGGVHGTTGSYGVNPTTSTTGSGIGGTHSGSNIPGTHSASGVGNTHTGSGIAGSHAGSHVSGSSTTTGTSGITGGTHPLVTGERRDGGLTGSGVGGTPHTGSNIPGTHGTHTGSGITGTGSHTGSHVPDTHTGATHTGNSALGSGHRAEAGGVGSRDYVPGGTIVEQGTHHSTARTPVDPYTSKGQRAMADAAEDRRHHTGHHTATQDTNFVPGSHPAAQNPSAIPTAGGERVGSISGGNGPYDDSRTHDNRTTMEKMKDKVVPSRTDRPDNPVTGENYGQTSHPSHTGSHTTHGIGGTTGSHNTTTGSHGLSGSHNTTTGSHGLTGHHGQYTSAATPLAHDSGFNDRHAGAGTAGIAGTGAGAGLAGAGHHNTSDRPNYAAGQQAAHDQYGSSGLVDNRSGMEKIKDKMIPSRNDRPDDPVTGQNYGQGVNSTTGSAGGHVPGTTGSGLGGNHTYGSGVNNSGVGGVTHGVGNVGLGGNSATGTTSHTGKLGGAYEAGYNDAVKHLTEQQQGRH